MIRVFDFRCQEGHVTEHFVGDESTVQCPQCHQIALRMVSAPRAQLEPFTGAFPSAADKWVRDRESKMRQERKNQDNHGTYK